MTAGHYAAMALLGLSCLPYFLSTETRRARRDGESSWVILWDANSLFMCQDEYENEDEDELVGSFWCIFNLMGDERTSTSSLLRLRTNE